MVQITCKRGSSVHTRLKLRCRTFLIQVTYSKAYTASDTRTKDLKSQHIAISSNFRKILERFVRNRLALELGIDFDVAQFGSRKESSCTAELVHMMHHWLQALDRGNDVRAVCLDFSAKFDRLPHQIIISKLVSFGVSDWIVAYVTDFLTGRSQFVCSPD